MAAGGSARGGVGRGFSSKRLDRRAHQWLKRHYPLKNPGKRWVLGTNRESDGACSCCACREGDWGSKPKMDFSKHDQEQTLEHRGLVPQGSRVMKELGEMMKVVPQWGTVSKRRAKKKNK